MLTDEIPDSDETRSPLLDLAGGPGQRAPGTGPVMAGRQ
jgi:hypothetical protein